MTAQPTKALLAVNSVAILCLVPVVAHQLGALKHLPDPANSLFDSDGITESKAAHPLGVPDSLPGIASYAITLTLAILARSRPSAHKLLAAKLLADGGLATFNLVRQVVKFRKLCSWCTGTALATYAMLYAAKLSPEKL